MEMTKEQPSIFTSLESLEPAYRDWLALYEDIHAAHVRRFSIDKAKSTPLENFVFAFGSVINLFPVTGVSPERLRVWHDSLNEAWLENWFKIGHDISSIMELHKVTNHADIRESSREDLVSNTTSR